MYYAMPTIEIYTNLIKLTKLFFHEASAVVNINTCPSKSFEFERRVREGCLLVPYFFLIIGELLNPHGKERNDQSRVREYYVTRGGGVNNK
jgi:hypothetical protein